MKALSYLILLAGIFFIASNIRDEIRGETNVYAPTLSDIISAPPEHVSREQARSNFRGAMTYQWFMALGITAVGVWAVKFCKRQDELDPSSPDFLFPEDGK